MTNGQQKEAYLQTRKTGMSRVDNYLRTQTGREQNALLP